MDIYEYAKKFNADYMDGKNNIYKVQEYNQALKLGQQPLGIKVFNLEEDFLGYAIRTH